MKPRPIQIIGNIAVIPLTQGKTTIIDVGDVPLVNDFNWYYGSQGYARTKIRRKGVTIHQLLHPMWRETDHANGDRLDNRRANLRECNHQQNRRNARKHKEDSSSKYKGVSWHKGHQKWQSRIYFNKRAIYLGRYATEEEAGQAYDIRAKELFGEFACLNFPKVT